MSYWFTADLHFNHTNVIKYANRPFRNAAGEPDVQMMNEALIERCNALVKPEDVLYILGDLALGPHPESISLVKRLNGKKHWVFGNHDKSLRKNPAMLALFESAQDFTEIKITIPKSSQSITLCHYAMKVWNKSHYGAWQLYGHSHGSTCRTTRTRSTGSTSGSTLGATPPSRTSSSGSTDEGRRSWKPIDHHGARDL
jgi:calcineurin-like phosphoesterase family protein